MVRVFLRRKLGADSRRLDFPEERVKTDVLTRAREKYVEESMILQR
jgi:hypothetical protein